MAVRKKYSKFLTDGEVAQIIEDLKKREGERVFKVNIHCVGLEYRMYNPHVSLEAIAGEDDALMEKYFEDPDSITIDELKAGLRRAVCDNKIVPVTCGTAFKNKGSYGRYVA